MAVPGVVLLLVSAVHGPWGDLLYPPVLFFGYWATPGRGVGEEVRQCTGEYQAYVMMLSRWWSFFICKYCGYT